MAEVRHRARIAILMVVVIAVFGGIGVRLGLLHLRPEAWICEPIEDGRMLTQKLSGNRGRIVDRNGKILAMDRSAFHLYIDPKYIHEHGDAEAVFSCLKQEFMLNAEEAEALRLRLGETRRQYSRVKKFVPENRLKCFKRRAFGLEYEMELPGDGGTTNIYLRGVGLEEVGKRHYPSGPLMAHVVGFVNHEGQGSAGVEQRFDEYLRGTEGLRVSKKDGRRREIYGTRTVDIPPQDGANVELTLDWHLQYVVEQAIEKRCHETKAKAAWAVVQSVRTGEILAMASHPTYDLNRFIKAPPEWKRNRAISFNYEPGSTMKAAVIAAALDHKIVTEDEIFDCENGRWYYGGLPLNDSHAEGEIPVADIVKYSSNIGTAKVALKMGNELLYDSLRAFRFGERLGVGLPGEEGGIFYSPKNWSKVSATRIGMGHEIAVTAVQVLSMMSAIAFNGVQMKPYMVRRVVSAAGEVLHENQPEKLGCPLSPLAARRMQRLLARVTEEGGTATRACIEGYRVAGKTGTAQKIRPIAEGGGYYDKNFTSSFAGFLPAESPEIAIIVVIDDPGEYTDSGIKINYSGGRACAPAFAEIAEFAVRYLRIPPEGKRVYVTRPDL